MIWGRVRLDPTTTRRLTLLVYAGLDGPDDLVVGSVVVEERDGHFAVEVFDGDELVATGLTMSMPAREGGS
jgi:hypothetical protein